MFQLLNLYINEPRKDTSLFKSFIQRNKSQYMMMGANPQVAFIDTVYKVLYHGSPLTPTAVPKAGNFDKISLNRSLEIYKERLGNMNGMRINIVGSFKEEEILPLIEKYIAGLPSAAGKTGYTDNKLRQFKGTNEFTFHKGKEEKSAILTVYGGETVYSPELAMKISALSEIMNIKIIEEMREKIQGIYGGSTFGAVEKVPYSFYQFVLQLPCGPEKVDTLLKEFRKELKGLADKGPEQGYLDKVKKQWLEGYRTDMKTNEFWISKLEQLQTNETTAERFLNWEKYVNQLKPADIQSAAKLVSNSPTKLIAIQMPGEKRRSMIIILHHRHKIIKQIPAVVRAWC